MPAKIQWIWDRYGAIFLTGDMDKAMLRLYLSPKEERIPSKIDPETAWEIIQATAWTADNLGAKCFGFQNGGDARCYNALRPFKMTGIIGGAIGLLETDRLWYNPEILLNDDYWMSCLNAFWYRYCFVDLRFGWSEAKTYGKPGAQARYRTYEREEEEYWMLRKYFGNVIVRKTPKPYGGCRNHPWEKDLVLPY